jgi:hypothetical protein
MNKLEEAIARLERAVARLEEAAVRRAGLGASGERAAENPRLRAVAGEIATRVDAAVARIDRVLGEGG